MNIDFWYRPVTPGVAGSSPVHSAKTKNPCKSDLQGFFTFWATSLPSFALAPEACSPAMSVAGGHSHRCEGRYSGDGQLKLLVA